MLGSIGTNGVLLELSCGQRGRDAKRAAPIVGLDRVAQLSRIVNKNINGKTGEKARVVILICLRLDGRQLRSDLYVEEAVQAPVQLHK